MSIESLNKRIIIFILLIILPLDIKTIYSTEQDRFSNQSDTICFKLNFKLNDTLIYKVESYDSIVFDYQEPLIKKRYETLEIICDSITQKGTFILSHRLIDFQSFESKGTERNIERKATSWLNRKAIIEIDSLGNRMTLSIDDSTVAGISPGGAFQPNLLFPFAESCKKIGESWIVETSEALIENGVPVPVIKYTSFFRAKGVNDTLEEKCYRFEYIKTGQGSYELVMGNDTILVTNIINGFGDYDLSILKQIPIYYYATVEQKITLHLPRDRKQYGKHFISSHFTLSEIKRGNNFIK